MARISFYTVELAQALRLDDEFCDTMSLHWRGEHLVAENVFSRIRIRQGTWTHNHYLYQWFALSYKIAILCTYGKYM